MDKDKDYTLYYEMDLDDIKQIIQEETKFVDEGWIPDSKEDRRNAIEWGLKVLQIDTLQDINIQLDTLTCVLRDIRSAIDDLT